MLDARLDLIRLPLCAVVLLYCFCAKLPLLSCCWCCGAVISSWRIRCGAGLDWIGLDCCIAVIFCYIAMVLCC